MFRRRADGASTVRARTDEQIDQLVAYVHADQRNRQRLRQMRTQLVEKHCLGCHRTSAFVRNRANKTRTMLCCGSRCPRIVGSILVIRTRGGCERGSTDSGLRRSMPANGRELIAKDPAYRQLLASIDLLVGRWCPANACACEPGRVDRKFYDRTGKTCGAIPTKMVVVVVDRAAREKPGFSRAIGLPIYISMANAQTTTDITLNKAIWCLCSLTLAWLACSARCGRSPHCSRASG